MMEDICRIHFTEHDIMKSMVTIPKQSPNGMWKLIFECSNPYGELIEYARSVALRRKI